MPPTPDRRSCGLCVGLTVPLFVPPFGVARVRERQAQSSKIKGLGEAGARSKWPIRTHNAEVEVRVPLSPPTQTCSRPFLGQFQLVLFGLRAEVSPDRYPPLLKLYYMEKSR